jgi:hypothetical protein
MKIKTKLFYSAIVTIGLLSALALSLFLFSIIINKEHKKEALANEFTMAITEVLTLSHDYTTFHTSQTERQLHQNFGFFSKLVGESLIDF